MRGSPPDSLLRGRIRMIKTSRTISAAMQVLLCLSPLAGPAHAAESVYTDLDLDACEAYFQAFQFVEWSGMEAKSALDAVLFETEGEA